MNEKYLFIGGPHDGKRMALPDTTRLHYQTVHMTSPLRYYSAPPTSLADTSIGITTHTYEIKRFPDGNGFLQDAVHSSVKNVLAQLIKGYHYHRKPRYR